MSDAYIKLTTLLSARGYDKGMYFTHEECSSLFSLINARDSRIAELEAENERLSQLLHDEMSQLEIATDLGNKRWIALNEIYEKSEKHSAWWCKRKAQEGLGIK